MGAQYTILRHLGEAMYFFISVNHIQLSSIYKGHPKDISQNSFLLLGSNKNCSTYRKMGGTGLILRAVDSKVNYSVLHLDFQGISMSPFHVLNPQTLSVRGCAKVPIIQMSNTPGNWVLLNSTLNTVH